MRWIDEGFREDPGHYLAQTGIAFIAVGLIAGAMLLLPEDEKVVTAALGATAFIIFAMPKHDTARTRNVIGGHAIGIGLGLLAAALVGFEATDMALLPQAAFIALVVAVAMLAMVITNTEHPPAAGNALAFAIMPFQPWAAPVAFGVVVALALARLLLRNRLRDLV